MPDQHRRDRAYCSATCRVRAMPRNRDRRRRRDAWLASPEGQAWAEGLRSVLGAASGKTRQQRERFEQATATGQTCAVCAADLGAGPIYRRRVPTGDKTDLIGGEFVQRAAPVCSACRCDHTTAWLCDQCRLTGERWVYDPLGSFRMARAACPNAGENHSGSYCEKCHPRTWWAGRCPGCERTVNAHPHGNMVVLTDGSPPRVYCSQQCRTRVGNQRAKVGRDEARIDVGPRLCQACGEVLDGKRGDATYCDQRCKQRAYRLRQIGGAS